ncbi:MAG: MlaD family protein [Pirellulaceae bacterium]|nr:MlaD family protein [Pirellulaceae bacterium]
MNNERILQLRVGVVVLAATFLTSILIFLMDEGQILSSGRYEVYVRFTEAPGVTVGTPVRQSGILIGRVSEVTLRDVGDVLVTLRIDSQRKLYSSQRCTIGAQSLLGDTMLEFVGGRTEKSKVINNSDTLEGVVQPNPLDALAEFAELKDELEGAINSISSAGTEVTDLAGNVNEILEVNEGKLTTVLDKAGTALDNFSEGMGTFQEFVGDSELKENLNKAFRDIPELVVESREVISEASEMFQDFKIVSQKAKTNLDNLEKVTEPLAERGDQLVANIESSTENLDILLEQLAVFSESLNSRDGTIGYLVNDPDLYLKLNRAAGNIEMISQKLEPIVDDVKVFADKIARDPKQLGVKGVFDRRQSGLTNGFSGGVFSNPIGNSFGVSRLGAEMPSRTLQSPPWTPPPTRGRTFVPVSSQPQQRQFLEESLFSEEGKAQNTRLGESATHATISNISQREVVTEKSQRVAQNVVTLQSSLGQNGSTLQWRKPVR